MVNHSRPKITLTILTLPASMTYMSIPSDHQSAVCPYGVVAKTSGAETNKKFSLCRNRVIILTIDQLTTVQTSIYPYPCIAAFHKWSLSYLHGLTIQPNQNQSAVCDLNNTITKKTNFTNGKQQLHMTQLKNIQFIYSFNQ